MVDMGSFYEGTKTCSHISSVFRFNRIFFSLHFKQCLTKWEQSCAVFRIHNWEPKNMLLHDGSTCECTDQAVGCRFFSFLLRD